MPWPRWTDFLAALRSLRATPVVTLSAILCLGLGIGVATDVASAVDRALVQTMPVRDPERLVLVYRTTPHFLTGPFSPGVYTDLAAQSKELQGLAALRRQGALVRVGDERAQVRSVIATANTFAVLQASPQRGRLFVAADEDAAQGNVVVVSDRFWRDRLDAAPSIAGRTIQVDGEPHTIVGVLPPDFHVRIGGRVIQGEVWTPIRFTPEDRGTYRSNSYSLVGRLAPGATLERADAEIRQLAERLVEAHPELAGEGARVHSLRKESMAAVRTPMLLVSSAVFMVLLIAATNVASLLLARGIGRRRETAVRVALGASTRDVLRPIVAECVLIALGSLVIALALGWAGIRTMGALAAARVPQVAGLTMDLRIVVFATVLALVVALVCGLLPASRSGNVDPQDALRGGRGGGAGRSHHRLLGALVIAEIALSLVLLIGSGLALRGFVGLLDRDPGFDAAGMIAIDAVVPSERYPSDADLRRRFVDPALAALRQIPGVRAAGGINLLPYVNWGWNSNTRYEGMPAEDPARQPIVEHRVVTPGFFAVSGQRLVAGRLLQESDDDRDGTPAVVVNEALVRRDFKGRDPIGQRFHMSDTTFATIVGVVSDIRNFGPFEEPRPEFYWNWSQRGLYGSGLSLVLRVDGADPLRVAPQVRAALHAIDDEVVITRLETMRDVIGASLGSPRFFLVLLGVFASVAVLLALAGVYGVMSYAVAQRRREIGIRSALGSTPATTLRLMLGRGGALVAAGLAIGVLGSLATTRFLQGLLYGVSPLDGRTWLAAVALMAAAGVLAAFVPARRSLAVQPTIALREE
jgi:putative ABC transport system permease protein